jgi:hypothetical protein
MLETVVRPMARLGLRISMRGRRAVLRVRASAAIWMPGAMAPPRYSPLAETASNVVAVPKSTTMAGPRILEAATRP